jgi:hypothetical protein
MPVSVCPMDTVNAPVERIWSILMDSAKYAEWSDLGDFGRPSITPPGPTAPGQVLEAQVWLGRTFRVRLVVREVNTEHHRVGFDVSLPLGLHNAASITATPLDAQTTRVAYG